MLPEFIPGIAWNWWVSLNLQNTLNRLCWNPDWVAFSWGPDRYSHSLDVLLFICLNNIDPSFVNIFDIRRVQCILGKIAQCKIQYIREDFLQRRSDKRILYMGCANIKNMLLLHFRWTQCFKSTQKINLCRALLAVMPGDGQNVANAGAIYSGDTRYKRVWLTLNIGTSAATRVINSSSL